ncbi:hypothetical protein ROA7450_00909 [Roseovarius albus]|uniref:Uncharacterized protein n=1 Tax=Roseovarius albus TaxID=1247867 RepID=A0A1X6YKF7_9RHOB|nr:hypothetical protein [Roseovarius albus]SLN23217.1 hypothetical protein ROA7450_00909 [Roseovarius albus]
MPKLIRLYIINAAIGFGLAAVFVGMLLWFNIANLWHLISTSDKGWQALLILWVANGIVFAGVQFAIAVMRMKDDDDDEPRGGLRQHVLRHEPARIPVRIDDRKANPFTDKR